jgi:hypothetical protein
MYVSLQSKSYSKLLPPPPFLIMCVTYMYQKREEQDLILITVVPPFFIFDPVILTFDLMTLKINRVPDSPKD